MKHLMQLLATFALATAIAASGHAGPGNGNGGNGKGNKPEKEQKQKPTKEDKAAEREARKAEREAAKAEREAEKEAAKAEREAEKEARKAEREAAKAGKKASKGTTTALSLGQIIITDSRILDLSGDYALSSTLVLEDGTSATTSVDLSIVQDDRGQLVGSALVVLADGSTTEIEVVGELSVEGDDLTLTLSGELSDDTTTETASIAIDGVWDGTAFVSTVTVAINETTSTFDALIVPANPVVGVIIEPALDAHVIGNKIWGTREVVLPWGNTSVRSQQMNKKGLKFMMHSGDFGIDLRGTVDELGAVDLSRAKLHLGYGTFDIDPATVSILPAVQ
jgi:hypothetical protein